MSAMKEGNFLDRRVPLGELLDLRSFREVCNSFVDLYRIGVKVLDAAGAMLVDVTHGSSEFCSFVYSHAEGARRCSAVIAKVKNQPLADGPTIHTIPCFTGLRYLAIPLLYEGDVVGRAVFGPFIPQEMEDLPPGIRDLHGLDLVHGRTLMTRIRRAHDSTIARVLEHFAGICEVLIFSSYQVYLTSKMHIESVRESYREVVAKAEKLEATLGRLRELDQLKSNFLATVSHELRTPLTSIIGYAEMLIEGLAGPLTPEQMEYLETIMDKGERLLHLITSILDVTRVESGRLRLEPEPVDLQEALVTAVSNILPQAKKKGIAVEIDARPPVETAVIDPQRLQQCLVNLLSNAVKFTPEGGTVVVVAEEAPQVPSRAQGRFDGPESYFAIRVRDTGIGIPEEALERIFDSFYQVDGSATREYGGVGLGLSIVKSYVEAHGGEILCESEVGKGTTFTLILPRTYVSPVRAEALLRKYAP